ncbi:DUF3180 domain-containing protein [Paeniglutamicibacter cryotolerans]|uniref:TRAP-type C4-dicarboxylate transport system permease small subunit n=1 Tax=Paeniglutamicibacter cryotolerans TaxID=670079 RepID=A0A839QJU6_9MICC|nr:DUF3180 domain-containing protein [Paeniglutamicibacter cryotolerans]MBB2995014.1 TRAP-type C4-dicarboxylate transport system permease small subunit [Paeniglutamicibacter cryotolerans]
MSVLRPLQLLLFFIAAVVLGWAGQQLVVSAGRSVPVLNWTALPTMAGVSALTLIMGIRVRRYTQGKLKSRLDPIAAARTLILAQASAYAGTLIGGWHVGILIELLRVTGFGSVAVRSALLMIVAAAVMVIVGWIVEQFCKVPPDDPSSPEAGHEGKDDTGYAAGTN